MKRFRKYILWFLLLPVACIAMMAFKGDSRNFLISKHLDVFHAVFRELDMMYVDTFDVAEVMEEGIRAMLSRLDPYTVFYPEEEDEDLKMMLTSQFILHNAVSNSLALGLDHKRSARLTTQTFTHLIHSHALEILTINGKQYVAGT